MGVVLRALTDFEMMYVSGGSDPQTGDKPADPPREKPEVKQERQEEQGSYFDDVGGCIGDNIASNTLWSMGVGAVQGAIAGGTVGTLGAGVGGIPGAVVGGTIGAAGGALMGMGETVGQCMLMPNL